MKPIYYKELVIANGSLGYLLRQSALKDKDFIPLDLFATTKKLYIRDRRPRAIKMYKALDHSQIASLLSYFKAWQF